MSNQGEICEEMDLHAVLHSNRGMMTIEAVVILPLSLMITFLLLWTGMLLYNRAAVSYAVSVAVIRGSRLAEESNEEIQSYVGKKIPELLEHKLVLMEISQMEMEVEVEVSYQTISASVSGNLQAPPLAGFAGDWSVSVQRRADRMRSSQIVRTIQRVDRLSEQTVSKEEYKSQEE